MSTQYKKSEQELQAIEEELGSQENRQVDAAFTARQWKGAADGLVHRIAEQREPIGKMTAKAQETDPNKQVYGKNMAAKIIALSGKMEATAARAASLVERIAPLVAAEEAEALAQAQREEAEAERVRRESEAAEAQRQAEAAAEAQARAEAEARARAEAEAEAAQRTAAEAEKRAQAEASAKVKAEADHRARLEVAKAEAEQKAQAAAAAEAEKKAKEEAEKKVREESESEKKAAYAVAAAPPASAPAAPAAAAVPPGVIKVMNGTVELHELLARGTREGKLVVVDFSAPWCGPCRAIAPFLDQLALEHASRVIFGAVDCEATPANRALAAEAGIRAFPTFHFYLNSSRVAELAGANRETIRALIAQHAPGAGGPAAAAAPSAPSAAPGNMTQKLVAALQVMKSSNSFDQFCAAGRTLITFVSNVLSHPDDTKYRRVRMSNARFHNSLGSRPGGVACMEAVGFHTRKENSDDFLVMDQVSPELSQVKKMLEDAMVQVGGGPAPQPARRAVPAPAMGMGGPAAPGFSPEALQQMMGGLGAGQGLPGFGGGMGNAGGMGLGGMQPAMMQQMLQNPQMMQAAMRMMQNPQMMQTLQQMTAGGAPPDPSAIAQMGQQMMSDPAMRQAAMEMMQGMGGSGGMGGRGGMPDMSALASMMGGGNGASQPPSAAPIAAPTAPPPAVAAPAPATTDNNNSGAGAGAGQEMTEEEMIQLAIRRSMEDDSNNGQQ